MPTDVIRINETQVVQLAMSFFEQSGLHGSAAALEWESGFVADGIFPDGVLALRSLLLKGRWSAAMKFVRGLELTEEETKKALFQIAKQKYVELMCIYRELENDLVEDLGNAIAVCFSELSAWASDPQEHKHLRNLASLDKIEDDPLYRDWTPFASRRNCFLEVWEIVKNNFGERIVRPAACRDRLVLLLAKGLLYESCETYCRDKVLSKSNADLRFTFGPLTTEPPLGGATCKMASEAVEDGGTAAEYVLDCNLFSWLHTVPWISLARDFVCRPLKVEVKKISSHQPPRVDSWTEVILGGMDRESPTADVKEKFWNEKISKNLIVDAPEILKRAEEVVNRWEERRKTCAVPVTINGNPNRDTENKNSKRIPGKLRHQKCTYTKTGASCGMSYKLRNRASVDGGIKTQDGSVREYVIPEPWEEGQLKATDKKDKENGTICISAQNSDDGRGDENIREEGGGLLKRKEIGNNNANKSDRNRDDTSDKAFECDDDLDEKHSEACEPETFASDQDAVREDRLYFPFTKRNLSPPQTEENKDSETGKRPTSARPANVCVGKCFSESLVFKDFQERRKYITELLNSKEQLRGSLLQILARKE